MSTYLVSVTPPSALYSSHTVLAVLHPESVDERVWPYERQFAKLEVLRSVALEVKDSAAS